MLEKKLIILPISGTNTGIFKAASSLEIPSDIVRMIFEAKCLPIREMEQTVDTKEALKNRIMSCFRDFGGANLEIPDNNRIFQRCVNLMLNFHKGLSLKDITIAFNLIAAGKLVDVSSTCYSGLATVENFGRIIQKYKEYRARVLVSVEKAVLDEQAAACHDVIATRRELHKEEVEDGFKACLNRFWKNWGEVPLGYFFILRDSGLLQDDHKIWVEVKRAVCEEFKTAVKFFPLYEDELVGDIRQCRNLCHKMKQDPEYFPGELTPRAKNRYERIMVFNNWQQIN